MVNDLLFGRQEHMFKVAGHMTDQLISFQAPGSARLAKVGQFIPTQMYSQDMVLDAATAV